MRKHSRHYLGTTSQNQTKTQSLSWELSGAVLWPQPSLSEVKVKVNYRPVGAVDGERLITQNVALRCWRGSWYHIWLWCEPANVWAKDRGFRILWASVHHRLLFKLQVLLSLPVPLPSPPVPLPSFCTLFHLFNCIYYNSSLTVSKFSASSHLHLPSYFSSPNWVTCSSFSHYPEIQCSDRLCRDADEQSSVRADVAPFPLPFSRVSSPPLLIVFQFLGFSWEIYLLRYNKMWGRKNKLTALIAPSSQHFTCLYHYETWT